MQFTKLRLTGFKSFVETTELEILPGVTGVVGPNGCGKSNLVEGLKWVMGETSAKQMRGSEMDDVIFGGTNTRPARNIAEAVLYLDNSDRDATAAFNDSDELEISRKIVRDKGSTYRVNAKEVRARDVHLLFADQASGARSTAMVSQGQIGEVVSAKPIQRRKLLEEAAGITGLHSRRHEAELRLRGAETNLERLDDILITLEAQLQSLRKQARQASRYRNLNDHIRKAEGTLFLILWTNAVEELEASNLKLAEAERMVAEMTGDASHAATEQANAATGLPELRQAEAAAAAALQRLNLARETLEEEEGRLEAMREQCETRLNQIAQDIEREVTLAADADAATRRLEQERIEITGDQDDQIAAVTEAGETLAAARTVAEAGEEQLTELTERMASEEARRGDLARRRTELDARIARLGDAKQKFIDQISELRAAAIDQGVLAELADNLENATSELDAARTKTQSAEDARVATSKTLNDAHGLARNATLEAARLEAEEKALSDILESGDLELWPPVVDAIDVEAGYEAALGAALGDDLSAATDEAAPVHWRQLEAGAEAPALPTGAQPLADFVKAPSALLGRLNQIGVVEDADSGWTLLPELKQGQRLVTRDGAFWRWDGYAAAAEAPTSAATRLEQRNRLGDVRDRLDEARSKANQAESETEAARIAADQAAAAETEARGLVRTAEAKLAEIRDAGHDLRQQTAENESQLAAKQDALERISEDLDEAEAALVEIAVGQDQLPDAEIGRKALEELRATVGGQRSELINAQSAYDTLHRQAQDRQRRLEAIAAEFQSWAETKSGTERQRQELTERQTALQEERERLSQQPAEIEQRRIDLFNQIEGVEGKRNLAADNLAAAETRLADADKVLRDAEAKLAGVREQRVRSQSLVEQAEQASAALTERMNDRLKCTPGDLRELSGLKEDAPFPELDAAEKRVERLIRERENMGPVNLRAETEAQELTEQIDTLTTERSDLLQAIDKLRRGINELNREGRKRLLASFDEVNTHFQELFIRLFGGGRAYLELTESDDPLEAGIEIMASPPGKRLQVLSLLSGGEQALTALALLFAVFLTNPAPICVLDEVDAPLDDANVDRFCSLVDEIAHSLSTRFLVITHHRMTMARVDRLYGVTMGERGVSQLVSVDLGQAMEIRATA